MPATAQQCREYRRRLRERVYETFGRACNKCGFLFGLELAHTKPTELKGESRGQTHRFLDALKNRDCYALLCEDCHYRFDTRDPANDWIPF